MNIPTTIFTGFLGSGKTTIISHLIEYLQANQQQVVYIKNEIGDTDIDTKVMKNQGIETEELLNGCICCTLVGPFLHSIDELIDRFQPSRIVIEASGAADPAALALMVSSHPRLNRDGVISIIDVVNFEGYQDLSITAQEQTKFTDLLIFNKVELADLEQKRRVVGYVRELNTHSPIIEAPLGKVDPTVVFGISSSELNDLLISHETSADNHLKEDSFETVTLTIDKVLNSDLLSTMLNQLPPTIFRAKGIVQTENGWQICNTVSGRTTYSPYQPTDLSQLPETSVLVFIGTDLNSRQSELEQKVAEVFV